MDKTDEPVPATPVIGPDWLPPAYLNQYLGYLQQYTHNVNLLRWFLADTKRPRPRDGGEEHDPAGSLRTQNVRAPETGAKSMIPPRPRDGGEEHDPAGDDVCVRAVDLDDDGYTGVVVLDVNGTRAVLESGLVSHYRWDEHTQIYFRHGWIKTWAPPLLLRQVPAEVEIYRAGEEQTFTWPIPRPAWTWSYKREAEHFVHCLQTGEPFRSSGEDTRTDVRLFEEIFRAYLTQLGTL